MLKFFRISTLPLNFFPCLIITKIYFKYDQIKNPTKPDFLPFPWLTNTLLSFLLAFFALIFSSLAFSVLGACSQLKASLIVEEEKQEEESIDEKKDEKEVDEYSCDSSLLSTSCDETSESEETDESEWIFGDDPDPYFTRECLDGSISDEESLIELDPKQKYWTDCYYKMEPFKRKDLLVEMYEEENMIEIDLAVGSIKCPRFEIKA